MEATLFFLELPGGHIACRRYGRGPIPLLALHGFGADGRIFTPLVSTLSDRFTLYAVDLPLHGKSRWGRPVYGPEFMTDLRDSFLKASGAGRFVALGYSLGGRLLLSTLPEWTPHLRALFMLAPDGFGTRGMTVPERIPAGGRAWLSRRLQRPAPLLRLAAGLRQLGIVDRFSLTYLRHHLSHPDRRERLLGTWCSLAKFPVKTKVLRQQLHTQPLPVDIFTGTRDPLVSYRAVEKALGDLPCVGLHHLDEGHLLVSADLGNELKRVWQERFGA